MDPHDIYSALLNKEPTYQTITYGQLVTGEPIPWYVLEKHQDKVLLLSECAFLFGHDGETDQAIDEVKHILFPNDTFAEDSSLFLPSLEMVNQFLTGKYEILCKDRDSSKKSWSYWRKGNPLWRHDFSEHVPWLLSTTCDNEDLHQHNKEFHANPYYGGCLYGSQWCVSDIGTVEVSIDARFEDNVGGGGFYFEKYAIRPALCINSKEITS